MQPKNNSIPLSKAIEIARQNPDSDFSRSLRQKIESGELDQAASMQGVDLSRFGRPKTTPPLEAIFGIPTSAALPTMQTGTAATTPQTTSGPGLEEAITSATGLKGATDVFGSLLARQGVGTNVPVETTQEFVEKPTAGQVAGAALQTAAVPASFALTGGTSVLGQAAMGGVLGYVYDVGSDLVAQKSATEVLTPGVGTAVGIGAPLAIGAGARLFGQAYGSPAGQAVSQALPETAVAQAVPETQVGSAAAQTAEDVVTVAGRVAQRGKEFVESQAERNARIAVAPAPVQSAIRANIDDAIIDLAQNGDEATVAAMREMVEMAEAPKTARPGKLPTTKAGDVAVEQYNTVVQAKQNVGRQIGELSDSLPNAKEIPTLPAQRQMRDILRANGIMPMQGGVLRFDNKAITPEQQAVVQKLYSLATGDEVLSARQIHQMDQLFSRLQRQSRAIDKVEDVYIKVPTSDGKVQDIPIFKVFRDIFSKQLDEVAPEFRALNKQYATYSNLIEDFEGSLIKNKEFSDIVSPDGGIYAEAGLRRMFGEGVGAPQNADLYEALDAVSRQNGYTGARADELYYFGNKLRDIYPDTIPETGLRKNISTSIRDVVGDALDIGRVQPQDQQKALKELLGFNQPATAQTTTEATAPVNKKLEAYLSGKPSAEGGYIKNPLANSGKQGGKVNPGVSSANTTAKLTDDEIEAVYSALRDFDSTPITVIDNGKSRIEMGNVDDMVRLDQLKAAHEKRALTKKELAEAKDLLSRNGAIAKTTDTPTALLEEAKKYKSRGVVGRAIDRYKNMTPRERQAGFINFGTDVKKELPEVEIFLDAVKNTPGAEIVDDGLRIKALRFQTPEQSGDTAIRTGVFYLPEEKAAAAKFYKGGNGYGGSEKMTGDILVQRPLFVKGATGGKAPEAAYDIIEGKGAYEKMRSDVLKQVTGWGKTRYDIEEGLYRLSETYDMDESVFYDIIEFSKSGNTLPYAVQEHIVANAVRNAGYDSVLGYSKKRDGSHFLSELFDVRESTFPTSSNVAGDLRPEFNQQ